MHLSDETHAVFPKCINEIALITVFNVFTFMQNGTMKVPHSSNFALQLRKRGKVGETAVEINETFGEEMPRSWSVMKWFKRFRSGDLNVEA